MSSSLVRVEQLTEYNPDVIDQINAIMPQLDPTFTTPQSQEFWETELIGRSDRAQLVAFAGEQVVGYATMSTIAGAGRGLAGNLEDFVVDQEHQGSGAAQKLWEGMLAWCVERGLPAFELATEEERERAVSFYERRGAELHMHYTVKVDGE